MTQDDLLQRQPGESPFDWCMRSLGPLASIKPPTPPTATERDAVRASLRRRLVCVHCARACEPDETVHRYQERSSRNKIVSVHAECMAEWGAGFKARGWTKQHFAAYYMKINTLAPIIVAPPTPQAPQAG